MSEHAPRTERIREVDYLDERINVTFEFEAGVAEHLPVISEAELDSRMEQYRILLGYIERRGESDINLVVTGLMSMEEHEVGYYQEGKEEVSGVNIPAIRAYVERIQAHHPEYADFNFIGDLHTHPLLPRDFTGGLKPWDPSSGHIESVVDEYERGVLTGEKPFIFGVGGPDESGETQYAFYRVVAQEDGYKVIAIAKA